MKNTGIFLALLLVLQSCALRKNHTCEKQDEDTIKIASRQENNENQTVLKGNVIDGDGEPIPFATVYLKDTEYATQTDIDGHFKIRNIEPGNYTLEVKVLGYSRHLLTKFEIRSSELIELEPIVMQSNEVALKPMIYLYPEDTTALEVYFEYDGELLFTYPEYETKWSVMAYPDGTLKDSTGRSYYGLYWEGQTNRQKTIQSGFIVSRENTVSFLEEKLAQLGLSEREANEFIVFWLPILNKNEQNFIHFDTSHYTEHARLTIRPEPTSLIRLMMLYCPANHPMEIPEQVLPETPARNGFVVVEWGGKKTSLPEFNQ